MPSHYSSIQTRRGVFPADELAGNDKLLLEITLKTDIPPVSMGMAIMVIMIAIAGIAMIVFKASPRRL